MDSKAECVQCAKVHLARKKYKKKLKQTNATAHLVEVQDP